jgi:RNA polymerase sigma-70 factor (ECF subfamily)
VSDATSDAARRRFTAIYDAHYHRVLGYARRRVEADDAADVAAETFATAWRRLEAVPEGEEALFWLYATARRVLANHHRGTRRRLDLVRALERGTHVAPEPAAAFRVRAAFAELRDDDRELLLLVAWEGLDAAAIAAVVGCSRNAARIRIHRARRRFARALAEADTAPRAAAAHPRLQLEDRR